MKSYLHSGCIGDLLYSLPSIKACGGGQLMVTDRSWNVPITLRMGLFKKLVEIQPYISGVKIYEPNKDPFPSVNFSTFRQQGILYGDSIIARQARWGRVKVEPLDPWLTGVEKHRVAEIVIARSARWHGFHFPWRELVQDHGPRMVFVGLPDEHAAFTERYGKVSFHPTATLYDTAQVIAGADIFIGNQSAPLAVAEGLKKDTIVEVCDWAPDCLYIRPGNVHVTQGNLDFAGTEYRFDLMQAVPIERDLMVKAEKCRLELLS